MLTMATLAVTVCGDAKGQSREGYWVQDCSAATENLLLAAHALGLGAVWLGVHPREDRVVGVRKILNIPDQITPLCVISVGYPAEPSGRVDRYREERVHRDRW